MELELIKDKITYKSQYTPIVFAELPIDTIEELALSDNVIEIGYCENDELSNESDITHNGEMVVSETQIEELIEFLDITGIKDLKQYSGLTGDGVTVGIIETYTTILDENYLPSNRCYVDQPLLDSTNYPGSEVDHATSVALMISGNCGIASESILYAKETGDAIGILEPRLLTKIEELIDVNASVINISLGVVSDSSSYFSKYLDYIISNYGVSVVKSAGNRYVHTSSQPYEYDGLITNPGNADNVITVGAYDNKTTVDKSDDTMYIYSSFVEQNVYNDVDDYACMKPDLVAPANVLCSGTSIAVPFVTGVIALMLECRPSLSLHPEVIKAILMASCHHKAKPYDSVWDNTEEMSDGLTEKQGAGVIDPYTALSITASGNYGYGIIEENTTESIRFHQSPYDATGMNVSIAWLRDVNKVNNNYTYAKRNDLNLYVYKDGSSVFEKDENGNVIDTNKYSSSTEMVYFPINTDTRNFATEITYDIDIRYENDTTDNSSESVRYGYAWSTDDEDYYSIFEYEGLYLIKNTASNKYLTYNTDNNTLSLMDYRGHYYNEYEQLFADGMILNYRNSIRWDYLEELSGGQFWTFEKVNYKKGDVDMNGVINSTDQNYISYFYNGIYSPTNAEKFLSDTNGDHEINNGD